MLKQMMKADKQKLNITLEEPGSQEREQSKEETQKKDEVEMKKFRIF